MKKRIEEKLGCTIEEFLEKIKEYDKMIDGCEAEGDIIPNSLTDEELDYLGEYLDRIK